MKALEILSDAIDQFAKDPIGFLFRSMLIVVTAIIVWVVAVPALLEYYGLVG